MGLAHALLVSRESEHGHRKFESLMTGMASVFQCQYAGIDAADCVYSSRKQRIMIFLNREYCIRSQLIVIFFGVVHQIGRQCRLFRRASFLTYHTAIPVRAHRAQRIQECFRSGAPRAQVLLRRLCALVGIGPAQSPRNTSRRCSAASSPRTPSLRRSAYVRGHDVTHTPSRS